MSQVELFEIELPTKEETTIAVKCAGKVTEIDLYDWDQMMSEVRTKVQELGQTDSSVFVETLLIALENAYGLIIGKRALASLLLKVEEMRDSVKKKYETNSDSAAPSESPQSSSSQPEVLEEKTPESSL